MPPVNPITRVRPTTRGFYAAPPVVRRAIVSRPAVHSCVLALAIVAASGLAAVARAAPSEYIGANACGACHAAALNTWTSSAHARASAPEVLGRRAKDAACLSCHATGEGGDRARLLAGVQCEACHGAGAAYAQAADVMRDLPLARALGLRDLSKDPAAVCVRCHRDGTSTRNAKFDYAAAWARIAH
jgi:hypothetical protein